MPIMPFLNGRQFDPEALRILGLAFDQVCIALQVETSDDDVRQAIANKVIQFSKAEGRRDLLCERILDDMRRPPLEV